MRQTILLRQRHWSRQKQESEPALRASVRHTGVGWTEASEDLVAQNPAAGHASFCARSLLANGRSCTFRRVGRVAMTTVLACRLRRKLAHGACRSRRGWNSRFRVVTT